MKAFHWSTLSVLTSDALGLHCVMEPTFIIPLQYFQ